MPHIVTTQGVVLTKPVLNAKGEPTTEVRKFGNREVVAEVHDHHRHEAGVVIEVDDETAEELIGNKLARTHVPELDGDLDADPTQKGDDNALE